jgi:uncharacterized membrane protein YbhN (UPF0104 family)
MGASETGYIAFFKLFFPGNMIFVSMLIWRTITYYLNNIRFMPIYISNNPLKMIIDGKFIHNKG